MDYIIFMLSMAALIYGAHLIIIEGERIALHYNISQFVIGATLIALGTSLPEMAASIAASFHHKSDLAVANIIGSVILNISLVLGVVFLLAKKISPNRDLFSKDSAWSLFPIFIFILSIYDGKIDSFEGFLLLLVMAAYLLFLSKDAKEITSEIDEDLLKEKFNWPKSLLLLLIGFAFTIKGADFAIESASNIAKSLGVSEWVIGLLLVAFGTSLPELIVSIVAALKNNADMAIGNIIGSNVANLSIVLGLAAIVNPLHIDIYKNLFDISAAVMVSIMLIFITANKLYNKSAGIVLLTTTLLVLYHAFSKGHL